MPGSPSSGSSGEPQVVSLVDITVYGVVTLYERPPEQAPGKSDSSGPSVPSIVTPPGDPKKPSDPMPGDPKKPSDPMPGDPKKPSDPMPGDPKKPSDPMPGDPKKPSDPKKPTDVPGDKDKK
jgi:hypothetical protein